MLSFRRPALLAVAAASLAAAQPALTTIQDILYRADGTRFNGTLFINYAAFQAGDTSNIATANLSLPIVNGVLEVALVPTTTASAGAQYNVTFNSQGVNQFTQVWAVPPSTVTLRVGDVLVSQGTVVGPPPVTTAIQISDVTGLENQLALRPQDGVGFTLGRAAVINSSGQIDGASGNLSDCVQGGRKLGSMRNRRRERVAALVLGQRDTVGSDQWLEPDVHTGVCAVACGEPGSFAEWIADETGRRLYAQREYRHVPGCVDPADRGCDGGQLPVCQSEQSAGEPDGGAGDLQQYGRRHIGHVAHTVGQLHHPGGAAGHGRPGRSAVSIFPHGDEHGIYRSDPVGGNDGAFKDGGIDGNGAGRSLELRNIGHGPELGHAELGKQP